jgi:hypothetical protein
VAVVLVVGDEDAWSFVFPPPLASAPMATRATTPAATQNHQRFQTGFFALLGEGGGGIHS